MQIVFPISDHLLEGSNQDNKTSKKSTSGARNTKLKSPKADLSRKGSAGVGKSKGRRGK